MKRNWTYFLLGVIFIFSSWAVLHRGLFPIHDFTHGARIAEMTRALQDGHFPVRWSQNFGFGYGMPLYQFYGPLPFYVAGLVYWLSNNLVLSVKSLFIICNILTLVGSYLFGKKLFDDRWAGVVTAAALTLAPYRALNLYIRGAVSEAWGIMAIPWILWSVLKTIRGEKNGWLCLTFSLTTLFLSHNLSIVMFTPVISGFVIVVLVTEQRLKSIDWQQALDSFLPVVGSLVLAIALSAFYLLPAYFEKDLTKVDHYILSDYFDFHLHFLYLRQFFRSFWGFGGSQWGPDDPISFFLGWGQIEAALLAILLILLTTIKSFPSRIKQAQYWQKITIPAFAAITIFFSAIITTQKTLWLWEHIAFLKYIQFPWRFSAVTVVGLAILSGWVTQKILTFNLKRWLTVVIMAVFLSGFLVNVSYFRPQFFIEDVDNIYYADDNRIRTEMSGILPDYIPATMPDEFEPASGLLLPDYDVERVEVLADRTQQKLVKTNFKQATELSLAIADYPHWRAWLDLEPIVVKSSNGHLVVTVPKGKHLLALKLQPTRLRLMSDLLSLAAGLIMLWLLFRQQQEQ